MDRSYAAAGIRVHPCPLYWYIHARTHIRSEDGKEKQTPAVVTYLFSLVPMHIWLAGDEWVHGQITPDVPGPHDDAPLALALVHGFSAPPRLAA